MTEEPKKPVSLAAEIYMRVENNPYSLSPAVEELIKKRFEQSDKKDQNND